MVIIVVVEEVKIVVIDFNEPLVKIVVQIIYCLPEIEATQVKDETVVSQQRT